MLLEIFSQLDIKSNTLLLTNVAAENAGTYRCEAHNIANAANSEVNVSVLCKQNS